MATHPVPDSLAGPAQGQAEPAQEIAVETAAVTALRVLSTDTNTLSGLRIETVFYLVCPIVVLRAIKLLMLARRERDCHSVIVTVPWTRRTVPVYTYTGGGSGVPSRVISQG